MKNFPANHSAPVRSILSRATVLALGLVLLTANPVCLLADDANPFGDDDSNKPKPGPMAAIIQPNVDSHSMSGAVILVGDRDKILDLEAIGYSNIEKKTPMKPDDIFWIASMGKAICGAALMMLVDDQKLSVDDPVEKYLPEFHGQMVKDPSGNPVPENQPIRIRDLLTHTSGLPFAVGQENPTLDLMPLADRVKLYAKVVLNHQPGTKFDYANAGINTVGRVIEVVSGMSYEKFLQTRLFDPLGMVDTTFFPTHAQMDRLVTSYQATPDKKNLQPANIGQLKYPLDEGGRYAVPAGGLFSTATDLYKFCQMFLNEGEFNGTRLLSKASVAMATSDQIAPSTGGRYGFGWMNPGETFSHPGAFKTDMQVEPSKNLIVVYMVSQAGGWANDIKEPWDPVWNLAVQKYGR